MLCEQCGQEPASVHMTKIINNKKIEAHLCQECAGEYGDFANGIDLPNIFAGLFEQPKVWGTVSRKSSACSTCGLEINDIRQLNQLGCSDCYQAFKKELEPLLRRLHGTTRHVGKVPAKSHAKIRLDRQINQMRDQLQQAISLENYEEAAKLRDGIRQLQQRNTSELGGE